MVMDYPIFMHLRNPHLRVSRMIQGILVVLTNGLIGVIKIMIPTLIR